MADPFTERLNYEMTRKGGELPYTLLIGSYGSVTRVLGKVEFSEIRDWSNHQARRAPGDR